MERPCKIIYVTPVIFGRTLFSHARINLAKAFINRGFEFIIIAPESDRASEILGNEGIDHRLYRWLDFPGVNTISLARGAAKMLKASILEEAPDVIISELRISSKSMARTITSISPCRPKWIIDDRSPPVMETLLGKLQMFHYNFLVPRVIGSADGMLVQNYQHMKFIESRFHCKFPDFILCGGGVDVNRFSETKRSFEGDDLIVVYAGSLVEERGVNRLIEACRLSFKSGIPLKLVTMGKGKMSKKLSELSSRFEWFDHRGFVSDKTYEELLVGADIGVVPHPNKLAWRICSPLKLKEYAGAGLIVLATDLPSHRELGDKDWLFLLNNDDFGGDFLKTVRKILNSRSVEELSNSARTDSLDFSWESATDELHEWIISNKSQ